MNALKRSLLIKTGNDNGWEVVEEEAPNGVVLASALHPMRVSIRKAGNGNWQLQFRGSLARVESTMEAVSEKELAHILRLTALQTDLFTADALDNYSRQVDKMLSGIQDSATEVERLVKQRVGQDLYRKALMDYWDGACAVTGISIPALLRASHAKAWADCDSDAERLNVYNGFLLCAHLDALFDTYLLSFDTEGWSILDSSITTATLASLGLPERFRLRKIAKGHQEFLAWHRRQLINQTRTR